MTTTSDHLAAQTLKFWTISGIRHGRIDNPLTTGEALLQAAGIQGSLGPHRKLKSRVCNLYNDIIVNRRVKKSAQPPANIHILQHNRKG